MKIRQITIHYVNKDIETPYNVSCDNFETFFGKEYYREKKIINEKQLSQFISYSNNYKSSPFKKGIDVRAKLYVYYFDEKENILCVDKFGNTMVNDTLKGVNLGILNFIEKNCTGFK